MGCEISSNKEAGICVRSGGPTIIGCTIRDHRMYGWLGGNGCGLYVGSDSVGKVKVGAGCVFTRNDCRDVLQVMQAREVLAGGIVALAAAATLWHVLRKR